MKKFKFQLEAVLKVTKLKKERAEIAFAEAVELLTRQEAQLNELQQELAKAYEDYNEVSLSGSVNIGTLVMYSNYFEYVKLAITRQEKLVEQARSDRELRLQELRYEMSRLESIEKLKEKRRQEYWDEAMAEEQKNLDEIGLQIYVRTPR